jgi:hypothetical protein
MTQWLEAGIAEPEENAVARKRLDQHVSAAKDKHATIEEF